MKLEDLYLNQYGFYKAEDIKQLGLPYFNLKEWKNVDDLEETLYLASKTTLKRLGIKNLENIEIKGFYRVAHGYTTLYNVPEEYRNKVDIFKDFIYVFKSNK